MKTFTLYLNKDDEEIQVDLRLDIECVLALKKKYNEMTVETIFSAIEDPEKLIFIFDKALNYNGNHNTVKTGKDLYNLIVDNDRGGMEGFWEVLSGIARESGILSEKMAQRMDDNADKLFSGLFAEEPQGNSNSQPN
jgi:hypothetical protein